MVTKAHRTILTAPCTRNEIRRPFFSIPRHKALRTNGFGTYFYRDARSIVGEDVIDTVFDALQAGNILKALNTTVIILVPKTKCPKNVIEFRPISCCKTIYKCITKVICARSTQDLVKHYGRKNVKSSCLMKNDLQKAYDTVNWVFLKDMM
ncbi:uncharacterized protein LOC125493818 [Beta vulgaris subsp. vulgaris]|uniref:uncharacterized protein LOC125493818 n=1 Tax=Beta vulgaris subsp. vulgaris TaxID=3555 RepID=UPI002037356F|nr:uncharacterized protein LOC125493818 [Beta vulgaris subsp. vulgaris]